MATRAEKIKVGTFVIAGAAILVAVLVVFGALRLGGGKTYYIETDDTVLGLEVGAKVLHNGVRVGNVRGMSTPPDDLRTVRIEIEVDDDTPVRSDTQAVIRLVGVTGLKIVDLRGGSATAPALASGAEIPLGESLLDKAQKRAGELLDQSTEIVAEAKAVLQNLRQITAPEQFVDLKPILEQTRIATAELARAGAALRGTIQTVDKTVASVGKTVDSTDGLVTDMRGLVRANADQLKATMANIQQASRSFRDLARELRQRPSRLVFSSAPKDRRLP